MSARICRRLSASHCARLRHSRQLTATQHQKSITGAGLGQCPVPLRRARDQISSFHPPPIPLRQQDIEAEEAKDAKSSPKRPSHPLSSTPHAEPRPSSLTTKTTHAERHPRTLTTPRSAATPRFHRRAAAPRQNAAKLKFLPRAATLHLSAATQEQPQRQPPWRR